MPDATMDAMRMPLRFFATAKRNGASLLNYMEVTGLLVHERRGERRRDPRPRDRQGRARSTPTST